MVTKFHQVWYLLRWENEEHTSQLIYWKKNTVPKMAQCQKNSLVNISPRENSHSHPQVLPLITGSQDVDYSHNAHCRVTFQAFVKSVVVWHWMENLVLLRYLSLVIFYFILRMPVFSHTALHSAQRTGAARDECTNLPWKYRLKKPIHLTFFGEIRTLNYSWCTDCCKAEKSGHESNFTVFHTILNLRKKRVSVDSRVETKDSHTML